MFCACTHCKIDKASDGEDWGYDGLRNFYNNVIKGDQVIPRTHFSSLVSGMFIKIDLRPYTSKAKLEFLVLKLEKPTFTLEYHQNPGFPGVDTYFKNHFGSQITFLRQCYA